MQFLSRLKLWQKLALLVVAMAVPTALLGVFYLGGANAQVALASDEIEGARYVQSVGARARGSLQPSQPPVRAVDRRCGPARRGEHLREPRWTSSSRPSIRAMPRWAPSSRCPNPGRPSRRSGSVSRPRAPKLSPDEAVARHNALIDRIFKLSETIAARSGLNVDPSLGNGGSHPDRHAQRARRPDRLGQHPLVRDSRQHQGLSRRRRPHGPAAVSRRVHRTLRFRGPGPRSRLRRRQGEGAAGGGIGPQRLQLGLRHGEGKDSRHAEDGDHDRGSL